MRMGGASALPATRVSPTRLAPRSRSSSTPTGVIAESPQSCSAASRTRPPVGIAELIAVYLPENRAVARVFERLGYSSSRLADGMARVEKRIA